MKNSELLKRGDVRPIVPGKEFIHALFHLERPSTTIAVRTYGAPQAQPQYSYRKPHLAVDPFFREETLTKKLQTVSLLLNTQHPESDSMIAELLAGSDVVSLHLPLTDATRGMVRFGLARVGKEIVVNISAMHKNDVDLPGWAAAVIQLNDGE